MEKVLEKGWLQKVVDEIEDEVKSWPENSSYPNVSSRNSRDEASSHHDGDQEPKRRISC